jgi:hypothetical protein
MLRKIIGGTLVVISAILLGLTISAIALVWIYKQPLVQTSTSQLQAVDTEVNQAHSALQNAELELDRTLRAVDAAELAMTTLKAEFVQVKSMFGVVNGTLESQLLPGLKNSRTQIDQAKTTLMGLQASLKQLNSLPFLNLNLPGDALLANLIAGAGSLDTQIAQVEIMVNNASTFIGDASYLMGGDFTDTKTNLQNFLVVVKEYDLKLTGWHNQLAMLIASLPGWIDTASIGLTIFLAWFGISQVSLILQELSLWEGKLPKVPAETS